MNAFFHKQQIVGSARELLNKIMIEQNLFSDNGDGRKVLYLFLVYVGFDVETMSSQLFLF